MNLQMVVVTGDKSFGGKFEILLDETSIFNLSLEELFLTSVPTSNRNLEDQVLSVLCHVANQKAAVIDTTFQPHKGCDVRFVSISNPIDLQFEGIDSLTKFLFILNVITVSKVSEVQFEDAINTVSCSCVLPSSLGFLTDELKESLLEISKTINSYLSNKYSVANIFNIFQTLPIELFHQSKDSPKIQEKLSQYVLKTTENSRESTLQM